MSWLTNFPEHFEKLFKSWTLNDLYVERINGFDLPNWNDLCEILVAMATAGNVQDLEQMSCSVAAELLRVNI